MGPGFEIGTPSFIHSFFPSHKRAHKEPVRVKFQLSYYFHYATLICNHGNDLSHIWTSPCKCIYISPKVISIFTVITYTQILSKFPTR